MTNETYGIESSKAAIDVAIAFPMQAAKTIKEKFKLIHILAFLDEGRELAEVIADRENVIKELKDLDATERAALIAHAKDKFDLPDDVVEGFVEDALSWSLSTASLFKRAKDLKNRGK